MSSSINKEGFTLVELMLAMSLFITVMIVATVGFVGINRTFSKGLVRKNLSEGLQRSVEDITRSVRVYGSDFSKSTVENTNVATYCVEGSLCYVWEEYDSNNDNRKGGLYRVNGEFDPNTYRDGEELLDERFVVDKLVIDPIPNESGLVRISGVIRTNESDAYNIDKNDLTNTICKGSAQEGASQNCALEKFNTVVRRVGVGS